MGNDHLCFSPPQHTGCNYVLQSTGQLYPHKKKHEKKEQDLAYRKSSLARDMIAQLKELATGSNGSHFMPGVRVY